MDEFSLSKGEATKALRAASGNVEDAIRQIIEA
jgi:NACalpha-BTF3-like transcription factor